MLQFMQGDRTKEAQTFPHHLPVLFGSSGTPRQEAHLVRGRVRLWEVGKSLNVALIRHFLNPGGTPFW